MRSKILAPRPDQKSEAESTQLPIEDWSEYEMLEQVLDNLDGSQVTTLIDVVDLDEY